MGRIVVGLKLTAADCRQRLARLIANLRPGDRVIAVHVAGTSGGELLRGGFAGIARYCEFFCRIKQVTLELNVRVGASVEEVLVNTAKVEDATKLVLTIAEYPPTGLQTSLANSCLKRLPPTCAVALVHEGGIVFEKAGTLNTDMTDAEYPQSCKPDVMTRVLNYSTSSCSTTSASDASSCEQPDSPVSVLRRRNKGRGPSKSFSGIHGACSNREDNDCASSSSDDNACEPSKSGWPFGAVSLDQAMKSRDSARNLSVVSWALQLPSRTSTLKEMSGTASCSDRDNATSGGTLLSSNQEEALPDCTIVDVLVSERLHDLSSSRPLVLKRFSPAELATATCCFSEEKVIGRGGCSKVYNAVLSDGEEIAVKCFSEVTRCDQEFLTEVEVLSTLGHRYIICLLGYCLSKQSRMLVYNLATRGNLEKNLHGETVLAWSARYKIACGIGEALEYLHDRGLVHRDIKTSNILLSAKLEPQISDFGFAKRVACDESAILCDDIQGTFGYLAPEYFKFGKLTKKADVYAFGVVLLELITGRYAVDVSKPKAEQNLVTWARPLLERCDMEPLLDAKLKNDFHRRQLKRMIVAAALCLRQSPQLRPDIRQVLQLLTGGRIEDALWKLKLTQDVDEEQTPRADATAHFALVMDEI